MRSNGTRTATTTRSFISCGHRRGATVALCRTNRSQKPCLPFQSAKNVNLKRLSTFDPKFDFFHVVNWTCPRSFLEFHNIPSEKVVWWRPILYDCIAEYEKIQACFWGQQKERRTVRSTSIGAWWKMLCWQTCISAASTVSWRIEWLAACRMAKRISYSQPIAKQKGIW